MVKKLVMQGRLEFAEPETIFCYLFSDDKFIKGYHKKINYDPYAEASCWNKDGEREVRYVAALAAPKMIAKLAGGDSFPVKELQRYSRNGNCYTISSEPLICCPGGDRFMTYVETVLSKDERGGCAVTVNITVEFKGGLWGLEGAIESFMESKARTTFDEWMLTARLFCEAEMGMSKAEDDEVNEEYFDANDVAPVSDVASCTGASEQPIDGTPVHRIFSRFKVAFLGNQQSPSGLKMFCAQTVLRELNHIQISCDASRGQLEKLNAEMLKLKDDLASMRSVLERQHVSVSNCNHWSMFGLGIATGVAVTYVYLHARRQT